MIKYSLKKGIVYINDVEVPRKYAGTYIADNKEYNKYIETLPNGKKYYVLDLYDNTLGPEAGDYDNTPPYYVPDNRYFFMGDNRDESADCRVHMGYIDPKYFVAKVKMIPYSFEEQLWRDDLGWIDQIKHVWTFIKSFRTNRFFRWVDIIEDEDLRSS